MNSVERREFRYFFISTLDKEVEARIEKVDDLLHVEYPNHVTETIYFTHGPKMGYTVPSDQLVRIRKYTNRLSETVELGHENVFLEVKTNHTDRINRKERVVLPGVTAFSVLAKDAHGQSISSTLESIIHLSPLFPTVATQVERQHWIHKSGVRITLDKEIRVFAFFQESLKGCHIGSWGEGKIEFKFPKSAQPDMSLVCTVTVDEMCVQKDPAYLERRLRECFFQSMTKNNKH